ncbi:MAG: hypothetical protein INR73_07430 [Williamsia sp.]|nr:hypothetical protein [Williamsia sp.]
MLNKRKIRTEEGPATASDKMAQKISQGVQRLQRGFATQMNKQVERMETKRLKVVVVLFFLLGGGYSLFVLATAVLKDGDQTNIRVEPIRKPQHVDKTGSEIQEGVDYVSEATFQKIQAFKRYMDSLRVKNTQSHDSILFQRPMLMDSIRMLEEIYQLQKQNRVYEK